MAIGYLGQRLEWKDSMLGAICVSHQAGTRWEPGGEPEETSADHRAVLPGHYRIVQRVPTTAPQCLPLSLPGRTSTPQPLHPHFTMAPPLAAHPAYLPYLLCAAPLAHFELRPLHNEVSWCCSTHCSLHHMHQYIAEHTVSTAYRYNTSRTLCFIIFMFRKFILCQGGMSLKHHEKVKSGFILKWDLVFLAFAIMTVQGIWGAKTCRMIEIHEASVLPLCDAWLVVWHLWDVRAPNRLWGLSLSSAVRAS